MAFWTAPPAHPARRKIGGRRLPATSVSGDRFCPCRSRVPVGRGHAFCALPLSGVTVLRHRPPGVHSAYSVFSDSVKNDTGYLLFNSIAWQGCVAFLLH